MAERIRRAYALSGVAVSGVQIHATVSIGIAFTDGDIRDVDALLLAADKALYRSKESGRDRVSMEVLALA